MPAAAMSRPAKLPNGAVYTTTSSADVPDGFCRRAMSTGLDGLRASTMATPAFAPSGQNRCPPLEKYVNPQCPTYANPSWVQTSALNPLPPRSFWPTTTMFSAEPPFVPPLNGVFNC